MQNSKHHIRIVFAVLLAVDDYLVQLEATAKDPAKLPALSEFWSYCMQGDQKRKPRIVNACTVIAARFDVTKQPRRCR